MREPASDTGQRAAAGHHDLDLSLEAVYARYSGYVWRIVRRLGIPEPAVEDVMHEVFLVVHRRLPEYDGRVAMTTWLYHQTRGVVSNVRRGRRREQRRLALVDPKPTPAPDPEAQAQRTEAAGFVDDFLQSLDAAKREVFVLADLEGMPIPEVAQALGIKLNTAYSRLRAARERFQAAVRRRHAKDEPPRGVRSRAG